MIFAPVLTLAGLFLASGPEVGVAQASNPARAILEQPSFGFCHDPAYPLLESERAWCPLVGEVSGVCPALPKACLAEPGFLDGPPGRLSTRHASEDESGPPPDRLGGHGSDRERLDEPERIELPVLGGVAQLMFWAILVGALLLLLAAIFKNRRTGSAAVEPVSAPPGADGAPDPAAAQRARRAMETDVDRLLAMATEAAAVGHYADAVDFGHAALLRRLDHDNLIRLHRSRTNGDYVRQLQGKVGFFGPVRDALRAVDRAQFGTTPPDRSAFEAIFAKVSDIVRKAGPLVLLLGVFGLSCDGIGQKSYPWQYSPSGSQGVIDLLEVSGMSAGYRTTSMDEIDRADGVPDDDDDDDDDADDATDPRPDVIVMLRDAEATEAEWAALYRWVRDRGGTLVIAGGTIPPWLRETSRTPDTSSAPASPVMILDEVSGEEDAFGLWFETDVSELALPRSQFIEGPQTRVLERDGKSYGVALHRGSGQVVVLADDHLFTNASLALRDNTEFLRAWLGDDFYATRVEFVDAWAQAGADDPLESLANSHLTPALVQVLAFVLVLYLWRGRRFGLARDPRPPTRRAFVQHARAMGHVFHRAQASRYATSSYATWALERLRDQFPIGARSGLSGLAAAIAHRTGRDETEVVRLLIEAHDASDPTSTDEPVTQELTLVRDLGRLLRAAGGHV